MSRLPLPPPPPEGRFYPGRKRAPWVPNRPFAVLLTFVISTAKAFFGDPIAVFHIRSRLFPLTYGQPLRYRHSLFRFFFVYLLYSARSGFSPLILKPPAAYVRVSTVEQALSHLSLEAQTAACRAYCRAHWPTARPDILTEIASAASTNGRPGLGRFLADPTKWCALVVLRLDRLARNALDLITIARNLDAQGVALHSVSESIDTHSPTGRLFLTVLAALAEFERDLLSARTCEALAAKRARGEHVGRHPFGFDPKTGAPDPAQLEHVRHAYMLARAGCPARAIARVLGLKPSTVRYVLRNPIYRQGHLL